MMRLNLLSQLCRLDFISVSLRKLAKCKDLKAREHSIKGFTFIMQVLVVTFMAGDQEGQPQWDTYLAELYCVVSFQFVTCKA